MILNKIKFSFVSVCLLITQAPSIQASEIHAILVADTIDSYLFETNLDLMQREVKRMAARTDFSLHVAVFEHEEVRIENLLNYIENMDVQPDDIILFYANNHGSRSQDKISKWPDLLFWLNLALTPDQPSLDFDALNELLKNKNPRLLISIAESCNSIIEDVGNEDENPDSDDKEDEESEEDRENALELMRLHFAQQIGPTLEYRLDQNNKAIQRLKGMIDDEDLDYYRTLYTDASGSVLISSSSPGESALQGIFTPLFIEKLEFGYWHAIYPSASQQWLWILERTSKAVQEEFQYRGYGEYVSQETQTIQYEIQLFD